MSIKKILIFLYKKLSIIYVFVFGRKSMQFFNDIVLSLSLNAKGFKNYGNLNLTGEKRFIKLIGKKINFSIDIGANVGKYTKLLLAETNSEVIAFEPLPKAFEELKEIEKNFSSRLNVYNFGIGNKNSNLELNYSTEKSELASFIEDLDKLSFIDSKNNKKIIVEVMTLDSFFKKYEQTYKEKEIDLLKIDTEGFELEVLNGASETLINKKPKFIQIEFNWHQLFREQTIYKFSKILSNYEVFKILPFGNSLIKIDPKRPESNIFHLSNFVFIRKDISKNY
tara:strand:- start:101 stop:943 length:843 start_codon:yes stop_codon:yes gene_type:complete